MKVRKIMSLIGLALMVAACNPPAGELVGIGRAQRFNEANPYGMVLIKKGSFLMGANSQSVMGTQSDKQTMVTVDAFWMDETEITNSEYKQFVNWVRDSIAFTMLINAGYTEYAVQPKGDEDYDEDNLKIDWNKKVPWNSKDEDIQEALSPLLYSDRSLRTTILNFFYTWNTGYHQAISEQNRFDVTRGVYAHTPMVKLDTAWLDENGMIQTQTIERPYSEAKDFVSHKMINVYPDTLIWLRDYKMSYNDPHVRDYFSHPAFRDYPVVGVTWDQAHAFCVWRTDLLTNRGGQDIFAYRLPTEIEWEYAARGGRKMATYPWGSNYVRDNDGCFFANFKPYRGSYGDDTGTYTMRVAQFRPNDYGLYDMAGNVAEWTLTPYKTDMNTNINDYNPMHEYMALADDPIALKRKVVRGGSWKDVSYYLQCGVRDYEYENVAHSYIGFRCVRPFRGEQVY